MWAQCTTRPQWLKGALLACFCLTPILNLAACVRPRSSQQLAACCCCCTKYAVPVLPWNAWCGSGVHSSEALSVCLCVCERYGVYTGGWWRLGLGVTTLHSWGHHFPQLYRCANLFSSLPSRTSNLCLPNSKCLHLTRQTKGRCYTWQLTTAASHAGPT